MSQAFEFTINIFQATNLSINFFQSRHFAGGIYHIVYLEVLCFSSNFWFESQEELSQALHNSKTTNRIIS